MAEDKGKEKKKGKKSSGRSKSPKRGKSPKRDKSPTRSGKKSSKKAAAVKEIHSIRSETATIITADNILDVLPQEYLQHIREESASVDPLLYYLPKQATGVSGNKFPNFRVLLAAAEDDIRLHRARLQAAKNNDMSLLRSYQLETDSLWLARQQRLNERELMLSKLDTERPVILKELVTPPAGLTPEEAAQVQIARWQRALELYVYSPQDHDKLGMLELLEQLSEGVAEVSHLCRTAGLHPFTLLLHHGTHVLYCHRKIAFPLFSNRHLVCAKRLWMSPNKSSRMPRNR